MKMHISEKKNRVLKQLFSLKILSLLPCISRIRDFFLFLGYKLRIDRWLIMAIKNLVIYIRMLSYISNIPFVRFISCLGHNLTTLLIVKLIQNLLLESS